MYTATHRGDTIHENELLPSILNAVLQDGNGVTLWRMPGTNEKHLLICTNGINAVDDFSLEDSKTGFIFAPFDNMGKKMFFRGDLILTFKDGILQNKNLPDDLFKSITIAVDEDEVAPAFPILPRLPVSAGSYVDLVRNSIEAIRAGYLEKVVPSRTKEVKLTAGFDMLKSFDNLCTAYPDAMVSMVSSDETGTWLGASPELIVSLDQQSIFRTVALAGTQRFQEGVALADVKWTDKEIEEQALVCRYIISCFKKLRVREYAEQGPRTVKAGNLFHLRTDFKVDAEAINFPQLASVMLKLLHPTSAVCGMPLDNAITFLESHEGYDRQYYSGFLGPVNFRGESHIYVNLRCLQLLDDTIRLYAGAGVTIDSIPENELEETEMKLDTLLSVIN